jgi:Ca2+-binding RTX toxin-like protein
MFRVVNISCDRLPLVTGWVRIMRKANLRRCLVVESLETRRLLAADLDEVTGLLTISGTTRSDTITVALAGSTLHVAVNRARYQFDASQVDSMFINAKGGNDRVVIQEHVTTNAHISGGGGNDRLIGGGGNDVVLGGAGNDNCQGGPGNDVVSGGGGNDWVAGDAGDDTVDGNGGNDRATGGAGDDQVSGGFGNDFVQGDAGDDTLLGGAGNDRVMGASGDDEVFGDAGNDLLFGDEGADQLFGGDNHDRIFGGGDNDLLKGNGGNDVLNGGFGDDLADGDGGRNVIQDGFATDLDLELTADLTSLAGAVATARYGYVVENGTLQLELRIEVDGEAADTPLDVVIDGNTVGTITTDAEGDGQLEFSSVLDQAGEVAFPDPFSLIVGSTLAIGPDLSGAFVQVFA